MSEESLIVKTMAREVGHASTDRICGIYLICNTINNNCYVGKSIDVFSRWRHHLKYLRKGKHVNPHLQNAWAKYGEKSFHFTLLEEASPEEIGIREAYFIQKFSADHTEHGYNLIQASPEGVRKISAETRSKMSIAQKAAWSRNREQRIQNMIDSGQIAELCQWNVGKKLTESTKAKMSKASLGKPKSEAHRKAIIEAHRGWIPSTKTRALIGASHRGQKHSSETRAKMASSQVLRRERERNAGRIETK